MATKKSLEAHINRLVREHADLTAEVDRLKMLLGTPEIVDFAKAVVREAAFQREKWGPDHDWEKTDDNWFWTLGWLAGKAVTDPHGPDDKRTALERKLHRIVTAAALACNWHAVILEKARREGKL